MKKCGGSSRSCNICHIYSFKFFSKNVCDPCTLKKKNFFVEINSFYHIFRHLNTCKILVPKVPNWNTKLEIKFWFLFLYWSWGIKHKTKWFFDFHNTWTVKFKFEVSFFVVHFNLKNEKSNLLKNTYLIKLVTISLTQLQ